MNEQVREQLRMLRLPGFLQGMEEQQESTRYADLSFEERLTFLVDKECSRRDNLRLQRRLKNAKLKQSATLDQVDFAVARGLSKKKFMELAELQWIAAHHNLMIVGPTGVGKSFLASVLGDQACKSGLSVRYIKTSLLLSELLSAKADGSYLKLASALARTDLLIVDEWLREPLSEPHAREILDLLDDRFRKSSTLFATQFPVVEWYRLIKDPTLAEAILDRVMHDSLRIELKGESMRKLTSKIPK
jgi:DNA replication protein DnaC